MAFEAMQSRLWTALPAIVQSFNAAQMTVTAQPTINGRYIDSTGAGQSLQMPVLLDVPVLWQGGGGATLTFPIAQGDECLVVFSSRCIDAWWSLGGAQDPPEIRMHDLSDGFALVGMRSLPRAYAVDTTHVMLRSDDGSTFVELNPAGKVVQITAPSGINLNGVTIDSSGNLTSPATVKGATDVQTGSISLKNHVHTGVTTGGGSTGGAVG